MMKKPSWDEYFMMMTFVVASRSLDPSTKCGCVLVDSDHTILSVGYNSPPRGCNDNAIPLTRPEKYHYFAHAEENAIVTGPPCPVCFRMMINAGIREMVLGPNHALCVGDAERKAIETLSEGRAFIVRNVSVKIAELLLGVANDYTDKQNQLALRTVPR